jgi:hypothetical protein
MKKRKMKKHSIYFDLVEAMGEEGCPICILTRRASMGYLSAILKEGVNDPPLRRKLRDSLGFCNRHAWHLRDMGDSLATAILYKDLVDELARTIEEGTEHPGECPACISAAGAEEDYIISFCDYLKDSEFWDKYDASSGLCHAHLIDVLKAVRDEKGRALVMEKELGKLVKLSEQLAEYIRKKDYRFADQGYGDERDSWLRAVEKVSGGRR